jgi:hypothetical protein
MTSHIPESLSVDEICANVKRLGYAARERVRLYGEEFELISDPFPDADGISVNVKSKKGTNVRVVRLPSTILQSIKGRASKAS